MGDRKLMLLTGGNSGIGLEACKILCAKGHKVVATVRTDDKGAHCISEVKVAVPNADIHYMLCEMSDPNSVRKFAEEFQKTWLVEGQLLDVLINNAGCLSNQKERMMCESNSEWELTVATNAIAPILLTDLLIANLKETAAIKGEARVVMVNSSVTTSDRAVPYQTDLDDVMLSKPENFKDALQAYKNSKVALMMATLAMVPELQGTGVTLNSLCPGLIPGTNLAYANADEVDRGKIKCQLCCLSCLFCGQSLDKGGEYIVQVADDEQGKTHGLFFLKGNLLAPSPQCSDPEKQQKMLQILRDYPK